MLTTSRTVRRGRPTSALGDVNGAKYGGGPRGSRSNAMNVLITVTTLTRYQVSANIRYQLIPDT